MSQKIKKISLSVNKFRVDRSTGTLSNVVLAEGEREAKGHGVYFDLKTLTMARDAIEASGGLLKCMICHETFEEWWNEEDRLEQTSGYFETITVDEQRPALIAERLTFYDAFKKGKQHAFDLMLEMAEKTPSLVGQSIECHGYTVFVGVDGLEWSSEPAMEVELMYGGMPVFRITSVEASAFVSNPAVTSGLFDSISKESRDRAKFKALVGDLVKASLQQQQKDTTSEHLSQNSQNKSTQEDNEMNILKAIRDRFSGEKNKARRQVALELATESEYTEIEKLEEAVDLQILRQENERLKSENTDLSSTKEENLKLKERIEKIKESGEEAEGTDLGSASAGGQKFTGHTAKALLHKQAETGESNFAVSTISDVYVPTIFIQGMNETKPESGEIMNSGIITESADLTARAQGGGLQIDVPFFLDPDTEDQPQSKTAPDPNNITDAKQVTPRINRVNNLGADAFARSLGSADPLGNVFAMLQRLRLRNQWKTLRQALLGLYGSTASAAFYALKEGNFSEAGGTPAAGNIFGRDMFQDGVSRLGEMAQLIQNGLLVVHPDIHSSLVKANNISFERPSALGPLISIYAETVPVIMSSTCRRAGTTSGFVYDSYLFAPGVIAKGYRNQSSQVGDIANLLIEEDKTTNDTIVYDRTSGFLHPNGAQWTGTPASDIAGPTNAELADESNWDLAFEHPENVGMVQFLTNA